MGATFDGEGVNFALFSANAELIELCLFSEDGRKELARLPVRDRDGDIWHIHVAGLTPGSRYGFRAHGPYHPEAGHRFNPHKLLIDPYAKQLDGRLKWSDAVMGYRVGSGRSDLSYDTRDSAFAVPKSVVVDPSFNWGLDAPPRVAAQDSVIYEAHVKGMTAQHPGVERGLRGSLLGLASEPVIDHLTKLGVTAVELMPVQAFVDDRYLVSAGLRNYWGYQTIGFFAPEPRYLTQSAIWEFQTMVRRFHAAGIEVILDVVYNHSGEGDELGPTLSFRGLDNRSYYRLVDGGRYYINDAGTGNTLNLSHARVIQMVTDSLRYWVTETHVDGFRFDLGTILAREPDGFDYQSGFLKACGQDPILETVKLIAEPWDCGPGGYQVGGFPPGWAEWNDQFRDTARNFWKGDAAAAALAPRLCASPDLFKRRGRKPWASVNFVTSHDGFTLNDLVTYHDKHNEANGEDNKDGTSDNRSSNSGAEGPTGDAAITTLRERQMRNLLATLLLSQGTPMITAGDEMARTQQGNNNAYCQDNDISWVNWDLSASARAQVRFVQTLTQLRHQYPIVRRERFLTGEFNEALGVNDVTWINATGAEMQAADWADGNTRCFGMLMDGRAQPTGIGRRGEDATMLMVLNGWHDVVKFTLPMHPGGRRWSLLIDTNLPEHDAGASQFAFGSEYAVTARSLLMFTLEAER